MNNRLDTNNWKWFRLGELFSFERGKCSNSDDLEDSCDVPYIGAKKTENGVMKIVKYNEKLISRKNCICFICQGAGSNGYQNYFDIDTIQTTSNMLGYNKNITPNIGLFIVTVCDLERFKWCFGRGRAPRLENEKIKLPVDNNGNPDWNFMENYIKELRKKEKENIELSKKMCCEINKIDLPIVNWKKIKVRDLFSVIRGSRIVRDVDYFQIKNNEYIYPVITSTTMNNSIDGYYNKYNCEGNVICCGGEASGLFSTYQKNKCWVMDRSRILVPKFNMNENIGLFLCSILNLNQYRFSYGRSANPEEIENMEIVVPIDENNKLNYKYIEQFMNYKMRGVFNYLYDLYLK